MNESETNKGVSLETLKSEKKDYFLAHWQKGELVMEPFCHCGSPLNADYFCASCQRQCTCAFVACEDAQTLMVVEKFIHGSPDFRNFETTLLKK